MNLVLGRIWYVVAIVLLVGFILGFGCLPMRESLHSFLALAQPPNFPLPMVPFGGLPQMVEAAPMGPRMRVSNGLALTVVFSLTPFV